MSSLKDVSLKDVGLKDVSLKDVVVPGRGSETLLSRKYQKYQKLYQSICFDLDAR